MPELSRFLGIETAELIAGEFPSRERKLVEAWIEIHHEELLTDWQVLNSLTGTAGFMKIAPLA